MVRLMRETYEPHRALWHVLAVIMGVSAIVRPPYGLGALVDRWVLILWATALLMSGALGIIAPFRQSHGLASALALERAALWVQIGTLAWIVVAAVYYRGAADIFGIVMYAGWIIANTIRDRRIASAITKSGDRAAGE